METKGCHLLSSRLISIVAAGVLLLGLSAAAKPKKPLMKDGKQVAVATHSKLKAKSAHKPAVVHGRSRVSSRAPHKVAGRTTMPASHDRLVPVPTARPLALPATPPTGEAYVPSAAMASPEDTTAVPPPPIDPAEPTTATPLAATPFASLAHGRSALHFPAALQGFFAALQAHEAQPTDTVRIMQWGDSHTAADMFSGEARAQMQARFGDGGVGYTYAGHPFAGYRILGSGRGQSAGWTTLGTHFTQLGDALLGLGGVAVETSREGNSVSLEAPCRTLDVQYLARGGGGSFQLADNGAPVQAVSTEVSTLPASGPVATDGVATDMTTMAGADRAGTFHYFCPQTAAGPHHFTLTTLENAPVRLLGTVALQAGVTWEAMGINGAEAPLMLKWNQALFGAYLGAAAPQLIVLAYGTNEAAARYEQATYEAVFGRLIDMLHRYAPRASILVLGPGDRSIGSTSYTLSGRGRHKARVAHHSYTPYSGTARIVAAQRAVCEAHACAFWDWQARQGGLGSMQRWVAAGLGQPDHTHFTAVGYRALADSLVADLLSAYDGFGKHVAVQ